MPRTASFADLSNPRMRVRVRNGKFGFIKVGTGNPDAIKGQQDVLSSCARSAKGLKGAQFKAKVKACMKK